MHEDFKYKINELVQLFSQFKSANKKRVLSNFFSLSVLQGTNLVLPLITFPYLVRVVGVEKFGLIAFAMATVAYLEILTDYGFDFSATRQISINRDNKDKVDSIYSSILSIKAILSVISLCLLTILIVSFNKFSEFFWIYYFTFGRVIGKSIYPVWYFQGTERMRFTSLLNILGKVIFSVAIFIFVKSEADFLLVPIFNSMGYIVVGIISLVQIRNLFGVRFKLQAWSTLKEHFEDGWHIFLSRIYSNLFNATNVFLLGLLTNNVTVGYYSIAEKIIGAVSSLFHPANSALYPYMSKLFHESRQKFYSLIKKVNTAFLIVCACLFIGAFLFGKTFITLVNGSYDEHIGSIYHVLNFKLLIAPFGSFFTLILINQNRKLLYLKIVKMTFLANIILVPVSIHFFSGVGMAFAVLIVGVFHVSLFLKFGLSPNESLEIQNEAVKT